jgi:hypothetical protein
MNTMMKAFLGFLMLILAGCGGGGGGGTGGTGSNVSGQVPYLVSGPSITFSSNPTVTTNYDVTVTIEADGPTGVMFADLWIFHETDTSNFTHLDLVNTPGTKRWTGTTNAFLPIVPGQYYIDSIVLDDGDPFTADPLRTGWYFIMPSLSTSAYYVDERILSGVTFLYYGSGLSTRPVGRFTLP